MKTEANLWPQEGEQGLQESDLVSDPTWPTFQLDQDSIKKNIFVKVLWRLKQNCGL